ncbi:3-isopropylmalate dehydratase small subunit [Striga asiatica]|uniref:3-isopropylmalate dehydratase small subunit n=1 Tax=Striga asiatica TaxID=4170 RepID=A0A5A7RCX4_STRAF|nr:3-isopropylmalate dehydratase small subunit [Striga asiatica]
MTTGGRRIHRCAHDHQLQLYASVPELHAPQAHGRAQPRRPVQTMLPEKCPNDPPSSCAIRVSQRDVERDPHIPRDFAASLSELFAQPEPVTREVSTTVQQTHVASTTAQQTRAASTLAQQTLVCPTSIDPVRKQCTGSGPVQFGPAVAQIGSTAVQESRRVVRPNHRRNHTKTLPLNPFRLNAISRIPLRGGPRLGLTEALQGRRLRDPSAQLVGPAVLSSACMV